MPFSDLIKEPLPEYSAMNSWAFLLFVACFLILAYTLGVKYKYIVSMFNDLLHRNERGSLFFEQTNHLSGVKLLLYLLTVIVISIALFVFFMHTHPDVVLTSAFFLKSVAASSGVLLVYLIYKYLSTNLVSIIFFDKTARYLFNNSFSAFFGLLGVVLFLPVFLFFYFPQAYPFLSIIVVFIAITSFFVIVFSVFGIFFERKSNFLYFILYLCAQEIIPLYLVYKTLDVIYQL